MAGLAPPAPPAALIALIAPAAPAAPAAPDPISYAYSTGSSFSAFAKFNGKKYFAWRHNMEIQLRALAQWEVVDGTLTTPVPLDPANPTPDEVCTSTAWTIHVACAYAEITLRVEDNFGEVIATIDNPHDVWTTLKSSYGSCQSGIQAVINAELTLACWDGRTLITEHCDHMKTLRTRLTAAGFAISAIQFYQHFVNSLPADYNMVMAVHNPITLNYSIDVLCDQFCAIKLQKELRTTKEGGTVEDTIALLAKQKESKFTGRSDTKQGSDKDKGELLSRGKKLKVSCWGCGKKGHYQRDCWSLKKTEKRETRWRIRRQQCQDCTCRKHQTRTAGRWYAPVSQGVQGRVLCRRGWYSKILYRHGGIKPLC